MKKIIFASLVLNCMCFTFTASAQQGQKENAENKDLHEQKEKAKMKEQQELIIRSKGDKDIKLNVEIKGDDVIVNGKPLSEFIDDNVSINKRKMIVRDGNGGDMIFDFEEPKGMPEMAGLDRWRDLYKNENSHKPFLGVTTEKTTDGTKIVGVAKGSAAEKAGLKKDDIITKIDEDQVTDAEGLASIIAGKKPKEEIKILYKREGKKKEVKAVLGERVEERNMVFKYNNSNPMVRGFKHPRADVRPMPNEDLLKENFGMDGKGHFGFDPNGELLGRMFPRQKKLGLKIQDTEEGGNVKIIEVEDSSAAQKAGLKKDDLVTEINGQKISNTDDAREQLQKVAEKSVYSIKANRNAAEMKFDIRIPKKLKTADL
jgi:serine protease Do